MSNKDKKSQTTIDKNDKKTAGRRKLLKTVVAGGGAVTVAKMMPDEWSRPVVDSIMLPSHARTSESPFGPFIFSGNVAEQGEPTEQLAEQGFSEELLEFFTPVATAGAFASDGMTFTANESGPSYLCSDWNYSSRTSMMSVNIDNTTPLSFAANCHLGDLLYVTGGEYAEGVGWKVFVRSDNTNISTTVEMVPGGPGCTSGDTVICD